MPQKSKVTPYNRLVVVVADGGLTGQAASRALADLAGPRPVRAAVQPASAPAGEAYLEVIRRGRRFLDAAVPADAFTLLIADCLAAVPELVSRAATEHRTVLTLLVLDHEDYRPAAAPPEHLNEELAKLALALGDSVAFEPGPSTVQCYRDPEIGWRHCAEHFTARWQPADDWVVAADIACAFVDSVQLHGNARLLRATKPSTMADAIADFLIAQAGADWGLHYFTGTGIAKFVDDLEQRAFRNGNPLVRGPSEHSLACSALARWTLDGAPFVIVATTGMHGEFRGTIANHVALRSKGFIICCESRPDQWRPFQGTIHSTADSRPALAAGQLPMVYIGRSSEIASGLAEAFAAYHSGGGPVLLIATREALSANVPLGELPPGQQSPDQLPRAEAVRSAEVDRLAALLNTARHRLLCQVGPLGAGALDLLYSLASKAGIGLVDSAAQPGTVTYRRHGQPVAEYLGLLNKFGTSARVYRYLHSEGELRPAAEQALLFTGTPIPEIDTPFGDTVLGKLAPIQIVEREIDRAPFAGLSIVGDLEAVLRALHERLDIDPQVLAYRQAAIAAARDSDGDVIGLLPVLPMTLNYFFRQLRAVFDDLIDQQNYRYTGIYEASRAALHGINALPTTDRGISCWFGSALMGDGLMALPGVLTRRDTNVVAFVGDGCAAMTPDIVPSLVQQLAIDRSAFPHNLSIFRFVNGNLSLIRTARESGQPSAVSAQTAVPSFTPEDYQHQYGSLTVRHRRVVRFGDVPFAEQLVERGTINLYSIVVGHNNEGEGLSPLASLGWQGDELAGRALPRAGVRRPPAAPS